MSRLPSNGHRNISNGTHPSMTSSAVRLGTPQQPFRPSSPGSSPAMSRAERFDDEKRRLIESCFSKLDANGQLAESYITHIRVQEDGQYPSNPPPPDSAPENKKARVIIIAVRSTGRVRMHKARENSNGSFSIGKTWNLEELSAIESFNSSSIPPKDEREQRYREWAGNVGFTVTITKPYYWQAGTPKEKDFFIASAVKIYRKYTKGQVPELKGFDDQVKAMILGLPPGQQQAPPPHSSQGISTGQRAQVSDSDHFSPEPPHPPFAQREHSRDGSRYRQSPGPPSSIHDPGRSGSSAASRQESPVPSRHVPNQLIPGPRNFASQEQMRTQSRDGQRNDHGRPGTSPGPAYVRSPAPGAQGLPPPKAPYAQSQRSGSPSSSIASGRDVALETERARPRSPGWQQGSHQQSNDAAPDIRTNTEPRVNGPQSGADLFQATKQRWMNSANQQQQSIKQESSVSSSSAPQLPPIEMSSQQSRQDTQNTPVMRTGTSEASSAGIDLADAAAVGALTSYWGPEPKAATSSTPPVTNDPSSPPTPERSKKRPPMSPDRNMSESLLDLRPAPLRSPTKVQEDRNRLTISEERSLQPAPKFEEPPEIRPLAVQNKRQSRTEETQLQMPGGFVTTPQPNPVQTPHEEHEDLQPQERPKSAERESAEEYRPGLGPMIKKDAVRNRFAKAASAARAANAFKPRPGGAAEKILKAKAEREAAEANGKPLAPDGITGVVPRPSMKREDESSKTPGLGLDGVKQEPAPKVEVSSPKSPRQAFDSPTAVDSSKHVPVELEDEQPQADHLRTPEQQRKQDDELAAEEALFEQRQVRKHQVKNKRRSNHQERNLAALGIDRALLEGRGLEFEGTLADFGWNDSALQPKKIAEIEAALRREQAMLEAGSWLSHSDTPRDKSVSQVEALLDKAIQECDEFEGLLTLYNVELRSLNDDISFIEAQSQGLQVQSANQRLLHNELQNLLQTVNLDRSVFEPLRHSDLNDLASLDQIEASLVRLYQAMITVNPSIRSAMLTTSGRPKSARYGLSGEGAVELSSIRALREKRDIFERESDLFCQRLMQSLDYLFSSCFSEAKKSALRHSDPTATGPRRLHRDAFAESKLRLWVYSPEIYFMKEVNPPAWNTVLRMYYSKAQPVYKEAFGENILSWRRAVRKPTADDSDLLFTATEKDDSIHGGGGGLAAARKLTVKRSQTLAKTLRNASGGSNNTKSPNGNRMAPGQMMSSEVFSAALDEMGPVVMQEQNFIVDLFHASSTDTQDFAEAVQMISPESRKGENLMATRPIEVDREVAKRIGGVMEEIFGFFAQEMGNLLEWSVASEPMQGVGIMAALSRHIFFLQDTSQEFLVQLLEGLISKLRNMWTKFVEEQVRAIEDTKVKIKKRKGVIAFMKTFPPFSAAVENIFSAVAKDDYDGPSESMAEVRQLIDDAYTRINRAMFDSLKVIAKESPTAGQSQLAAQSNHARPGLGGGDDPEDKAMLNYHILLIENMNHYIEEVDDGDKESVLAEWKGRALMERAEALDAYVGRVLRRPLGKLMVSSTQHPFESDGLDANIELKDFLDQIEAVIPFHPTNPAAIASRPSTSRKAARNIFSQHDSKEIRRGIETLRKRIEKHFGDADEEMLSRNLVNFVCKECERGYERILERAENIIRVVYPNVEGEKAVEIEFSRADVQAGFRR